MQFVASFVREELSNLSVLEVACGTGFWSEEAAGTARHLTGIDSSREMLAIVGRKQWPAGKTRFLEADAFSLEGVEGDFDAALAVFWISHIAKSRIDEFLDGLHKRVGAGAVVVMADNVFNDGLGGELVRPEGSEDTFKERYLPDGSRHQILKNYYDESELREMFEPRGEDLDLNVGKCYWWLSYRVRELAREEKSRA